MPSNLKKLLDDFFKKNRRITITFICIVIITLGDIIGASIYKYTSLVEFLQKEVHAHRIKIDYFDKKMVVYDALSRDIVKRASFNAYIKRKDTEYHTQARFNTDTSSRIGFLEGKINLLSSNFSQFYSLREKEP